MAKKEEKSGEGVEFEVRTPDPGFRGERIGVKFFNGVGVTTDKAVAEQLAGIGYQVVEREVPKVKTKEEK